MKALRVTSRGGQSRRHFLNALFYFVSHTSQGLSHSGWQYDKQVKRQEFLEFHECQKYQSEDFSRPDKWYPHQPILTTSTKYPKMNFVEILTLFFSTLLGATALVPPPPPLWHPPWAIIPEKVIQHHRKAQGRFGGTGTVPLRYTVIRNLLKF